eukprot:492029-Amphidinium_carterae.1
MTNTSTQIRDILPKGFSNLASFPSLLLIRKGIAQALHVLPLGMMLEDLTHLRVPNQAINEDPKPGMARWYQVVLDLMISTRFKYY